MAARPSVGITTQIGVESTPGTGVSAGKKFSCLAVDLTPQLEPVFGRAAGAKVDTYGYINRQWTVGSYQGAASYNELQYLLASLFGLDGSVTTVETGVYLYTSTLKTIAGANTLKRFTIERGDATAAVKAAFCAFNSLNLNLAPSGPEVSGDIIGSTFNNATTLTSSPTTLAASPIAASTIDWYVDSASDFGTETKWAKVNSGQLSVPSIVSPEMVQNTTYPAFSDLVETAVDGTKLTIRTGAETQDRAIFTSMATSTNPFRYVRCQAVGSTLAGAAEYPFLKFWMACKLESAKLLEIDGKVYGYEYVFRLVDNGGTGEFTSGPLKFKVQNTISAL